MSIHGSYIALSDSLRKMASEVESLRIDNGNSQREAMHYKRLFNYLVRKNELSINPDELVSDTTLIFDCVEIVVNDEGEGVLHYSLDKLESHIKEYEDTNLHKNMNEKLNEIRDHFDNWRS